MLLMRNDMQPIDIITGFITLCSVIIVFIAIWKLYIIYGRQLWLVPAVGIGLFLVGAFIDLLDEFSELSDLISDAENCLTAVGISVFSFGLLMIARQLIRMSISDPLTGLHNKRYLEEMLAKEILNSRRNDSPFTVIFLDIDHFKKINDTMGHMTGDSVLRNIALLIKEETRMNDTVARFGGDEFVIVMPDISSENALGVFFRVNTAISSLELPDGTSVEVSFGAAQFPGNGEDPCQLLAFASKRMYENRRAKS